VTTIEMRIMVYGMSDFVTNLVSLSSIGLPPSQINFVVDIVVTVKS